MNEPSGPLDSAAIPQAPKTAGSIHSALENDEFRNEIRNSPRDLMNSFRGLVNYATVASKLRDFFDFVGHLKEHIHNKAKKLRKSLNSMERVLKMM